MAVGTAAVLTDSGYVGQNDEHALESILDQAAAADSEVVAVLPLHSSWLTSSGATDKLVVQVNGHGIPVALVLEHRSDPLGTQVAVRGLVGFLHRSQVPVSVLSTDVSGVGALAFGARWSAVGVRSALRHLYPVNKDGFSRAPSLSAMIRPMLSIVTVTRIAEAWSQTRNDDDWVHDIWTCSCSICNGRTLEWLAAASEIEVNAHTFEILAELRDGVCGLPAGRIRERSWLSKCHVARFRYEELRLDLKVGWDPPGYLRGWAALWQP